MKNRLSILITIAMLLSDSSMASLDEILGQFSKLEIYNEENDLCAFLSICSHLDEIIANNNAMPEAWVSQLGYENESQLKNILEMISEQELRDCLSQLKDDGQVEAKLFILKDHEYYHCILFQTLMWIRRNCSTNEHGIPHSFIGENVVRWQVFGSIVQAKIKQLTSEYRSFEKRSRFVSKRSDASSMKVRVGEEKLEVEPLKAKHSNARYPDKASESSVRTSVLLYMSKGRKRNLNCKVCHNRELVTCRHLSAWWLNLKEFEYGAIDSEENISRCNKIPYSAELNKNFLINRCPSEGIYFEISQFHQAIYDVAISLSKGQEKRYLVNSSNHGMGLCIKRNKYNNIIIYYYDPNDTLRHKEIIINTVGDLKYLKSYDFWNPRDTYVYFPGEDKVCCLLSLHTKDLQKDCKVVCMTKPSASLMYLLGAYGHYGHAEAFFDIKVFDKNKQKELIAGKMGNGTPALYLACSNRHLEAVSALMAMITNVDLDPDVKKELLAGRQKDGTSSLFIACQKGYHEIVTVLIAGIFSGDLNLSNGEKTELLAGKRKDGCPILNMVCQTGHPETVTVLIAAICSDHLKLTHTEKAELLAGKNGDDSFALYMACQTGHPEIVTALIAPICSGDLNLNNHEKSWLLAGKSSYGYSALYAACYNGHHKVVIAFMAEICRGDLNLSNHEKAELLAGKSKDGYPILYMACKNGHPEIVTALIAAICSSDLNLNNHEKSWLLAGKSSYGYSALYAACYKGHHKVVIAFMAEICRGDLNLSNHEKVELLAEKSKYGCSALYIACHNGHLDVVNALVSAICSNLSLSKSKKAELLAGADGVSALERASALGHDKIVEVLRALGVQR